MSAGFMALIAVLYLGACLAFVQEGKLMWGVVAFSWGVGNAVLAFLSK